MAQELCQYLRSVFQYRLISTWVSPTAIANSLNTSFALLILFLNTKNKFLLQFWFCSVYYGLLLLISLSRIKQSTNLISGKSLQKKLQTTSLSIV